MKVDLIAPINVGLAVTPPYRPAPEHIAISLPFACRLSRCSLALQSYLSFLAKLTGNVLQPGRSRPTRIWLHRSSSPLVLLQAEELRSVTQSAIADLDSSQGAA
jgi:hypothetical protein